MLKPVLRSTSLLLLLIACKDKGDATTPAPATATGDGIFAEGCPEGGAALARQIGVDAVLPGKAAVGTEGDYLLANDSAAFVITEPDKGSTYYYYGGIVADAVAMSDCVPADDRLDEVAIVLGQLDLANFNESVLRGFRGTHAEVLADGSDGGPATVRVHGVDDSHWLVEYELMLASAGDGGRPLSGPLGVAVTVDYTLYPDSPVLWIDVRVENTGTEDVSLFAASLLSFGETMDIHTYASGALSISGFSLGHSIPWMLV